MLIVYSYEFESYLYLIEGGFKFIDKFNDPEFPQPICVTGPFMAAVIAVKLRNSADTSKLWLVNCYVVDGELGVDFSDVIPFNDFVDKNRVDSILKSMDN